MGIERVLREKFGSLGAHTPAAPPCSPLLAAIAALTAETRTARRGDIVAVQPDDDDDDDDDDLETTTRRTARSTCLSRMRRSSKSCPQSWGWAAALRL